MTIMYRNDFIFFCKLKEIKKTNLPSTISEIIIKLRITKNLELFILSLRQVLNVNHCKFILYIDYRRFFCSIISKRALTIASFIYAKVIYPFLCIERRWIQIIQLPFISKHFRSRNDFHGRLIFSNSHCACETSVSRCEMLQNYKGTNNVE